MLKQQSLTSFRLTLLMVLALFVASLHLGNNGLAFAQSYDSATLESLNQTQNDSSEVSTSEQEKKKDISNSEAVQKYADSVDEDVSYGYDQSTISTWRKSNASQFGERLQILWQELPLAGERFKIAFSLVTNPAKDGSGQRAVLTMLAIFGVALLIELFTTRKLLNRLYAYANTQEKTNALKYKFIATRICIQLIGIAILGAIAYVLGLFLIKENEYLEFLFVELLAALVQFRLWLILIRNIFSPTRQIFRPIPMEDAPAKQLYLWFTLFFAIIEFGAAINIYFATADLDPILLAGILIPYTLFLNLIILSQVWLMRDKIANMFIPEEEQADQGFGKLFLMQSWPFLFSAWMIMLWTLWLYNSFIGNWDQATEVGKSWWITLAFPIADRMWYGLIRNVEDIEWLQSPRYQARASRFIRIVQTGFRFVLAGIALYLLSNAGGLEANALMSESAFAKALKGSVNVAFFGVLGYVVWELFHALIERNLPMEEVDAIASLEGDGGGAGATRAETLVPLMRTVMTVVLTIFFVLTVLHSLGIAIGPLLAGAGVIGIAIGFGAQKLVQDIISGVFFLIDDAFRRGEYIELEGLKGTVEKISLRSMQLRHHLGAVQTIPYGEIKTVKNLSRDWITMKLELRLSYDTDIEKVRKIIKKVGQEMLAHPEMGPSFILPLKSQGVMRVEESALIVRMKFTTHPGEQWVIRREAYRNVRDALAAGGIYFAHREVRVRVPELEQLEIEQNKKLDAGNQAPASDDNLTQIKEKVSQAAAAAATGIIASEALKQGKLDSDDMDDEM